MNWLLCVTVAHAKISFPLNLYVIDSLNRNGAMLNVSALFS